MHSFYAYGESRLHFWQRVREFAVPPSMIESATVRRGAGDWAGACAAARVDVDVDLQAAVRVYRREFAARVRTDLRQLAPDLLRWHMPRIAPDGLLRPGLTVPLAGYHPAGPAVGSGVHLVARTAPAWADAGQRISLALWDTFRSGDGSGLHPHPRPDRRFRLDLHRHLWDAHRAGDLRERAGAGAWAAGLATGCGSNAREVSAGLDRAADGTLAGQLDPAGLVPQGIGCAVDRWASEAATLLRSQGRNGGIVTVRLAARRRLLLHIGEQGDAPGTPTLRITAAGAKGCALAWPELPELPDAAIWVLPDLALLRTGMIDAGRLHPLVAAALVPGHSPDRAPQAADGTGPRLVECRGAQHRIGLVDGVLVPLDHHPAEIRREELLAALGGPPLPCLRAIDEANRHPECLVDIRARLDHGDAAGALAVVEGLLGPNALLRGGALRDELEMAALRRVTHGLYRAGLAGSGPIRVVHDSQRRLMRSRRRHAPSR